MTFGGLDQLPPVDVLLQQRDAVGLLTFDEAIRTYSPPRASRQNLKLILDTLTACEPGAGPCDAPHASPGCNDVNCCKLVCDVDPNCCNATWDAACVDAAVVLGCAFSCPTAGSARFSRSGLRRPVPGGEAAAAVK